MSTPFLGEVKLVSFNFPPKGWAECNGQLMPINQNQALFAILGTTYGGNGQTTFALPDLRGRVPVHFGSSFTLGQKAGEEAHTLTINELPTHIHALMNNPTNATSDTPSAEVMLGTAALDAYHAPTDLVALEPSIISSVGGSQPHENRQPFLTLNYIIALQGIFPSQN